MIKVGDQYLTFKNYKEPLQPIPKNKGHGFYGTLLVSLDGKKVQCHICGGLFREVGIHVQRSHEVSVVDYKKQFQLTNSTALISEEIRMERKETFLKWWRGLSDEDKAAFEVKRKEAARKGMELRGSFYPKERLEAKNKKGTCPDQLLEKIHEVVKKIGHTPTLKEFIAETGGQRYRHLLFRTFGSWKKALKMAGLNTNRPKVPFIVRRYSTETLLEYLTVYAQEYGRVPTASDCRRGMLPQYETYQSRFGTFENARVQARVYDFVDKSTMRGK